jgi:glycosyltransferase involved in cell wall biosynthesis
VKVCLAHDWLTGMRGGEKVLETLCHLFPDAPLHTLFHFPGSVSDLIEKREVHTSPLNSILQWHPLLAKKYRHFLPLYPWAVSKVGPSDCDLILSTSHCVMRGLPKPKGAFHISYLHTPMRYIYDRFDDYFGADKTDWLTRQLIKSVAVYLRSWEQKTQDRADAYLCNSKYVRSRIKRIYQRDATVVYPPVQLSRFTPLSRTAREGYYLYLGALVPYKKPDIAIQTFTDLGLPLVVAGTGPEEEKLKAMAGDNIIFKGRVSDHEIPQLYANAKAFVFPGEEDFGITPLEAQASGTPVIALGRGGALETVRPRTENDPGTGLFFESPTVEAMKKTIQFFESERCDEQMPPQALHAWASAFDVSHFEENLKDAISSLVPQELGSPFL